MVLAGPLVALVSIVSALIVTNAAGVPLRDPDHVAGRRLLILFGVVGALFVLDVAVRACRRMGTRWPSLEVMGEIRRERWTRARIIAVLSALISFYVSYLAYRNLKSVVPLLRPELFDRQLAEFDRALFGGNDPAVLLHTLLGTGLSTYVLSAAYMLLFAFIPGTLAAAVVFARDLQAGLFYATAQSINWLIGAASYFLLPSLGPVYYDPAVFAALPSSAVGDLQALLLDQRTEFLRDPAGGTAQSIGAFASLHVSIFFTGALATHLLGLSRGVRIGAWVLFALTVLSTIHLGWHYVADDLGGLVLGVMALVLARALTGFDLRTARHVPAPSPTPA